ncbi:MAG: hypothetical protein IBJ11_10960 [Phycisphaerales bacterium]|nr:hypothetical protein [Phycisphaerales bacterium]
MIALLAAAYRPILDPISELSPRAHDWWWLTIIPLALFVSIAYKGVRHPGLDDHPAPPHAGLRGFARAVVVMATQIILAMIALAAGLYILVEIAVPILERVTG